MYSIIQKRKIWLSISGLLFVVAVVAIGLWGFKFGIDFTGGSLLEVRFTTPFNKGGEGGFRPTVTEAQDALKDLNLGSLTVQPAGEKDMILRFQDTTEEKHQEVLNALGGKDKVEELRFDSVGPSIGQELKRKSIYAIFFVLLAIVAYISLAFRKVSKPVASWKYGVSALIAMFHDVIITLGVFSVLGKFADVEINTPFVAAVLTVIGYSVHDTIVVFDRTRENLPKSNEDFAGTVNMSLNQTLVRSINTSLTVILTLVAVIIFGGPSIRVFASALAIGIFIGTYSSIFVASPLLVVWEKWKK
ncbi:protein translocase subunit SecF [Candidatus Falkowbacteria bacterium]|nr:protein translocase subunit SecF [Candidatus Falkowbacteria bacterium]